jgi:hypothetical protein
MFGREPRLPCDLLFGTPPYKERPTLDHAADLVDSLHEIHDFAWQHMNLARDRMKTRYDCLAKCAGYQEGNQAWLHRPTRTKERSPKLQSLWEGPYSEDIRANDVVYGIQRKASTKLMVVHLDSFATNRGTARDERP